MGMLNLDLSSGFYICSSRGWASIFLGLEDKSEPELLLSLSKLTLVLYEVPATSVLLEKLKLHLILWPDVGRGLSNNLSIFLSIPASSHCSPSKALHHSANWKWDFCQAFAQSYRFPSTKSPWIHCSSGSVIVWSPKIPHGMQWELGIANFAVIAHKGAVSSGLGRSPHPKCCHLFLPTKA